MLDPDTTALDLTPGERTELARVLRFVATEAASIDAGLERLARAHERNSERDHADRWRARRTQWNAIVSRLRTRIPPSTREDVAALRSDFLELQALGNAWRASERSTKDMS